MDALPNYFGEVELSLGEVGGVSEGGRVEGMRRDLGVEGWRELGYG